MHRHILFLGLFLLVIGMISCSSDDDSLDGTYKITAMSSSECSDPLENFSFDFSANDGCSTVLGEEVCGEGTLTLTDSGGFSFTMTITIPSLGQSFNQSGTGSYTVDGNMITICDGAECESSTFTLGSGNITIRFSEEDDSCVLTLSGEKK